MKQDVFTLQLTCDYCPDCDINFTTKQQHINAIPALRAQQTLQRGETKDGSEFMSAPGLCDFKE